ncbi:3-deoxy-D-manno-octulosonic acid transferase (Kdo transferase) (Lipid IV(A) 3-deoxy-D-manno-octulosonic acid transferase) [Durusdinium trenchii]|uniref:3-deoxy-D-manno-octulosonic acid transferase (Kdo transferase) (Lipid IV(A) 3-deoxy-D-manno-octulosonic acid transferase) n=1 Tax=Durusdinium trenchii TaxID=1381693 RepID=A0ABP0LMS1_9DINO
MTSSVQEPFGLKIYRAASSASEPVAEFLLKRRLRSGKEDPARINERRGVAGRERPDGMLVWIHGASVGESLSVIPLVRRLQELRPDLNFLVTTGTVTSAKLMKERLPDGAMHQYIPVDHPLFVKNFLNHWKPDGAIFVESEFWPNLILGARDAVQSMALVNGRISPQSFNDWKRQPNTIRFILSAFDTIIAQDYQNADRLVELSGGAVEMFGNLKNAAPALPADEGQVEGLKSAIDERPVWLAASTHPGEEDIVLAAHKILQKEFANLLTIIAPRHPSRGQEVQELATAKQLLARRRSEGDDITKDADVYIADTLGELGLFYRLCNIAFVGGGVTPKGGHNPLEPARLGVAILHGPHTFNFVETYRDMRDAGAAALVRNDRELATAVRRLLADEKTRSAMSKAAHVAAEASAHPGPLRVDASKHNADDVGDEALLLSRYAPVWIARNRPDGAKAAADGNADVIIMDDGFQNPKVKKTVSILLLDAQDPRGNGCIFPAGPLREPVARAQSRADITVAVDADAAAGNAAKHLASRFSAWLEPVNTPPAQTVAAFSGIGKPDKFFDALRRKGFTVAETISFPDHHPFTQSNLAALTQTAARTKAQLITTEKDFVRLPNTFKENVLTFPVEMKFNAPTQLIDLILEAIDRRRPALMKYQQRAITNMKHALPDWTEQDIKQVMGDVWENLGRTGAEYAHLDKLHIDGKNPRIEHDGFDRIRNQDGSFQQVIFVTGHFANWEIPAICAKQLGVSFGVIYRAANNPLVDELIIHKRAATMTRVQAPKGRRGARELVAMLRNEYSVAMLVDQKLNDGISVPFMGRNAMTAPAAARMALKFNVPLVPIRAVRLNGAHFRVTVEDAIQFEPSGDTGADVYALTEKINKKLEEFVRTQPAQWLWFHRRWPKDS